MSTSNEPSSGGGIDKRDSVLMRVTDVIYDDSGDLVVTVVGRTADGRRVAKDIYGTEPYFFVSEDSRDPRKVADGVEDCTIIDIQSGYESYDGIDLVKVVTQYPSGVKALREGYEEGEQYESDLIYERRCTADYRLSGYIRVPDFPSIKIDDVESVSPAEVKDPISPRISFIDIEVEAPDEFYDGFAEDAPGDVQAITAYDSFDEEYTLFCLDPDREVNAGEIRGYIEEHWGDLEIAEEYVDVPIQFKRFKDETSLLSDFVHYIQEKRPDAVTGWNYIDFDWKYLYNRIKDNGDLNVHALSDIGAVGGWKPSRYAPGLPAVDMMEAMQKIIYGEKESWRLEYIANDQLDVGKIQGEGNAFDENRTMFMAYNIVDVQLCVALNDAHGVMQFWYQVADICSIPIYSVGSTMKECEGYLFKHRENDEILPVTPEDNETGDIDGGFVMPPSDGIKEWIGVTDLKSLYPSSIITCNISKETLTRDPEEADIVVPDMPLNYEEVEGESITEEDIGWQVGEGDCIGFSLDQEGILPKYLKLLFFEREKLKNLRNQYDPDSVEYARYDSQQRAVKVIMNSFFGVSDNPYFRLCADGLGGAITAASRFVQWFGVQKIEGQGYNVVYGDTDSLMLRLTSEDEEVEKGDVIERGEELDKNLVELMSPISEHFDIPDEHPYVDAGEMPHDRLPDDENHLWQYEFEKLYRRFFQAGSKKRYGGNVVWDEGDVVDKISTTGMESERSDTPALAKKIQKKWIELVLKGEDFDTLTDFIQEKVENIREGEYAIDKIGVPSTINKPPRQYPNGPMPRAVLHTNKHIEGYNWQIGDDPWLVYVRESPQGTGSTDVVALSWVDEELPEGYSLDTEEHVEKVVQQPIKRVIQETDYSWREFKTGKQENAVIESSDGFEEPDFDDHADDFDDPFQGEKGEEPQEKSAFDW